jgi:hypothetical protein
MIAYSNKFKIRVPEFEDVILKMKYTKAVIEYAKDVIGGVWPEGESRITKRAEEAYTYAMYTKRRFKDGEPAIRKSEFLWGHYKDKFKIAE